MIGASEHCTSVTITVFTARSSGLPYSASPLTPWGSHTFRPSPDRLVVTTFESTKEHPSKGKAVFRNHPTTNLPQAKFVPPCDHLNERQHEQNTDIELFKANQSGAGVGGTSAAVAAADDDDDDGDGDGDGDDDDNDDDDDDDDDDDIDDDKSKNAT
ncbi:hypothetical protein PoB_001096500 [Plakobranchus ocellatus]|uniref:Uncharacterized protein n=1 Tax=Plakobranchus ocellatus TaxID=259542 RepID=A0AAV3YPU5_9GAST|nr:hypothetical protein PoB_001096500 [Plakobranchus ocellatus]